MMGESGGGQAGRMERVLARLYGQGEFKIKLGLGPMQDALDVCGHPEGGYPCVVVAGTNGKGSVSAMLAAVAQFFGVKVGLYTSPHLIHFGERIRVDGRPLDEAMLLDLAEGVLDDFGRPLLGEGPKAGVGGVRERRADVRQPLTFFELATLMGVLAFSRCGCEFAVMEVGMGGRLDATNALTPCLGVITAIGLDHQAYLGETIEEIALEKAGIMRAGVPVVLGTREAQDLLRERAEVLGAPAWCLDREFGVERVGDGWVYWGPGGRVDISDHPWAKLVHGRDNIATALTAGWLLTQASAQAIPKLKHQSLTNIYAGICRVRWPGRFWRLGPKRTNI
jgi:dihydrofolate synthase/folylpolyglutamate synthase